MAKRILLSILFIILIVVGVVLIKTFTFQSRQTEIKGLPPPDVTPEALKHFVESIGYKTVSFADSSLFDSVQFIAFRDFLEKTYPLVHKSLKREIVEDFSLLFTWEGQGKNINPVVLMAHQDVVPVEGAAQSLWTVDPFSGTVKDNFIWGRGTTDDKINLISILETVEKLLGENFTPQRTIYLAFGHDEEVGGKGAIAMASLLKERGIKVDLVLDEGGIITREKVPGMKKTVALLGTSEKGIMTLKLKVEKSGGHAAMPENETAIDILAAAITRLRKNEFEARFSPSTGDFIKTIGPEMPFTQKMAFANLWLFRPMVNSIYEQSNTGNAMIRTTVAPTILEAGVKDNVIPSVATAVVNFRLLPGDSSFAVIQRVKEIIKDERIQITATGVSEATGITDAEGFAYQQVAEAVKKSHDGIIATPFMMIGATDSRHFREVSDGIIKFSPMIDPIGYHGVDERVSLESFQTSLWFFEQLIRKF